MLLAQLENTDKVGVVKLSERTELALYVPVLDDVVIVIALITDLPPTGNWVALNSALVNPMLTANGLALNSASVNPMLTSNGLDNLVSILVNIELPVVCKVSVAVAPPLPPLLQFWYPVIDIYTP